MLQRTLRNLAPFVMIAGLAVIVAWVSRAAVDPQLEARNATLESELGRVKARNTQLSQKIQGLKVELRRLRGEPAESLHHARTQLGMVRPGEMVYQFVPQPASSEGQQ